MYHLLHGVLIEKGEQPLTGDAYAVLLVGGVGYEVSCTQRCLNALPPLDSTVTLFTHTVVREDFLGLVGFASPSERDLYRLLLSANGVGSKSALALLDALSPADIFQAVLEEDPKVLTVAKGIGSKGAQQIVLDLKGKVARLQAAQAASGLSQWVQQASKSASGSPLVADVVWEEVEQVLEALGYSVLECKQALAKLGSLHTPEALAALDAETLLRLMLKDALQQ